MERHTGKEQNNQKGGKSGAKVKTVSGGFNNVQHYYQCSMIKEIAYCKKNVSIIKERFELRT